MEEMYLKNNQLSMWWNVSTLLIISPTKQYSPSTGVSRTENTSLFANWVGGWSFRPHQSNYTNTYKSYLIDSPSLIPPHKESCASNIIVYKCEDREQSTELKYTKQLEKFSFVITEKVINTK